MSPSSCITAKFYHAHFFTGFYVLGHKGPCAHRSLGKPGMLNTQGPFLSGGDKIKCLSPHPEDWEWILTQGDIFVFYGNRPHLPFAVEADLTQIP